MCNFYLKMHWKLFGLPLFEPELATLCRRPLAGFNKYRASAKGEGNGKVCKARENQRGVRE